MGRVLAQNFEAVPAMLANFDGYLILKIANMIKIMQNIYAKYYAKDLQIYLLPRNLHCFLKMIFTINLIMILQ